MNTVAKKKLSVFAERLRELRTAAELTQRAVATHLGVGYQTYMRWERGETEPAFSVVCELAALFGCELKDFQPTD